LGNFKITDDMEGLFRSENSTKFELKQADHQDGS